MEYITLCMYYNKFCTFFTIRGGGGPIEKVPTLVFLFSIFVSVYFLSPCMPLCMTRHIYGEIIILTLQAGK